MENNNAQENINSNVNINLTNNEEQKPEKKELPIYILPVVIVLIICIIGGIFISRIDFSSNGETGTPSDDTITSTKQDDDEFQNDNLVVKPNDEQPEVEEPIVPDEPQINNPTEDTESQNPTQPNEPQDDESVNVENSKTTQSE